MKKLSKKGSIADSLMIVIVALLFSVIFITSYYAWSKIHPKLDANLASDEAKNITAHTEQAMLKFDTIFIAVVIGMILMTALSAYYIEIHPAFFVVSLIFWIVMLLVVPIFSNVYEKFASSSEMSDAVSHFGAIDYISKNLPVFFTIIVCLVVVLMYGKFKSGGGGI